MKVFISIDMEGISGLANWKEKQEVMSKHMELDLLAAIEGAFEGGADYILVADSHATGMNINPDVLPPDVDLIRGYPRPLYMVEGLTSEFDIVFFIGYHAPAGFSRGQMDHTFSSFSIYRITVNGEEFGEAELNALYAGELGVPVGLITGDKALFEFSSNKFPPTTRFVITKDGISKYSARLYPLEKVRNEIKIRAKEVVSEVEKLQIFKREKVHNGYVVEIELLDTLRTDFAALMPGIERVGGRKVRYSATNAREVLKLVHTVSALASFVLLLDKK